MEHNWDDAAGLWEQQGATLLFAEQAFSTLEQLIDLQGKRVFDLGCGTGLLSQKMAPLARDIVALDGSEAMIEELDKKQLANVEPVVDFLSRGLIAQHPAFRRQFDCVVASSVCGFLDDLPSAISLIYALLDKQGVFVHWDWLDDQGLSQAKVKRVLSEAGFSYVAVSLPFAIQTEFGLQQVVMGVGQK